jgi:hypothetical protein
MKLLVDQTAVGHDFWVSRVIISPDAPYAFVLAVLLPEGQTGEACKISNKAVLAVSGRRES